MSITVLCDCGETLKVMSEDLGIHNHEIEIELSVEPCPKCLTDSFNSGDTHGFSRGYNEGYNEGYDVSLEEARSLVNTMVKEAIDEQA